MSAHHHHDPIHDMNEPGPATALPETARTPWWLLAAGVVVFVLTVFYLTDSVLPPMLDTDVTIPAEGFDAEPGGPGGAEHTPPPGGFDHGPGGGP